MVTQAILGIVIGIISGIVAALCGVGGGIIMVPAFVFLLGLDQKTAVATSLAAIILTSIAATTKNHSNNFVNWNVVIPCALAAAATAWLSADYLKVFSNQTLTRIFAVVLIAVGVKMLIK